MLHALYEGGTSECLFLILTFVICSGESIRVEMHEQRGDDRGVRQKPAPDN
jgi:hypothetical protein